MLYTRHPKMVAQIIESPPHGCSLWLPSSSCPSPDSWGHLESKPPVGIITLCLSLSPNFWNKLYAFWEKKIPSFQSETSTHLLCWQLEVLGFGYLTVWLMVVLDSVEFPEKCSTVRLPVCWEELLTCSQEGDTWGCVACCSAARTVESRQIQMLTGGGHLLRLLASAVSLFMWRADYQLCENAGEPICSPWCFTLYAGSSFYSNIHSARREIYLNFHAYSHNTLHSHSIIKMKAMSLAFAFLVPPSKILRALGEWRGDVRNVRYGWRGRDYKGMGRMERDCWQIFCNAWLVYVIP